MTTPNVNPSTGFVLPGQGGTPGVTATAVTTYQLGPISAGSDSPLGGLFAWMSDISRNFAQGVELVGQHPGAVNEWAAQQGAAAGDVPGSLLGAGAAAIGATVGSAATSAAPGVGTGIGTGVEGVGGAVGTVAATAGEGVGTGVGAGIAGIGSGLGSALSNVAPGLTAGLGGLFGGTGGAYALGFVAFLGVILLLLLLR